MQMLTVSKAKSGFSRVARNVIKNRRPVVVRTPAGFVQIVPFDLPEDIQPAPRGAVGRLTRRELWLHNHFGESI
jgi:hypothetical protein